MTEDTLAWILIIAGSLGALLALAFGIWVGLGSPGLYDKYAPTGRAPRQSPWRWLLGGRRRARSSRFDAVMRDADVEDEEDDGEEPEPYSTKPDFSRGRRFRR
ncbi:hypothetical protein [Candidatus Palauibacter sp.]|uniref:hypothetical protein n=1 Tax=Candidatus Palauibacter sp. TaxID=3101350 RepID=UPI003B5B13FB